MSLLLVPTTPFSQQILLALVGLFVAVGAIDIGAFLLLAFKGLLRTGELLQLHNRDIGIYERKLARRLTARTTGQRRGVDEVVIVHSALVVAVVRKALEGGAPDDLVLRRSPSQARRALTLLLAFFQLDGWHFGWYSGRRGGASHLFPETQSMEQVLVVGRWAATRAARIYFEMGLAELVSLVLNPQQLHLISAAVTCLRVFLE